MPEQPESSAAATRRGLAGEEIPEGEDRLLTVPNLITLVRLLCIPVFLWMLFGRELRWQAAVLLGVLGATDWVDGWVARRFGQVSNFGKMFDPTVDRLLMIVGVGSIIIVGAVPLWFGILVIAREVVMSIYVVAITAMGARRMDVSFIGKTGTFCQMVAFPLFLIASDESLSSGLRDAMEIGAWATGIPGLVFGYIAFAGYLRDGPTALREGRQSHDADLAADLTRGLSPNPKDLT
ncbi:MAG: CDP-alcohol phosphatidyltransferase family protein [Actinomycetia bacterium]|nr:CDP-alcohol phosphatidyltransferase family protein [Actinomycetes bacterium]